MADKYVYKISSRYFQKCLSYDIKHVKNKHFSRHFLDFTVIYRTLFFTDFDASKNVLGSFVAFSAKIWPKTCTAAPNPDFLGRPFYLVTWDGLDLHYGHKAQEMIITNVSETIHAD